MADSTPRLGGAPMYLTVAFTGAAVMVVEVVGTRVLAPVFGASLFVWAALLAVTLCSLAVGYYTGGALVDRRPVPSLLGLVITSASLALGIAVLASRPVLAFALDLGPRAGPLLSALLLFSPCLACLGTIGPIVVRLATKDLREAGHGVGRVYAISTAGSLLGTLVAAFQLIPTLETNTILLGTAVLLCLNGGLWLAGRIRLAPIAVATAMLPGIFAGTSRALPPHLMVVERAHSPYGLLEVIDDSARHVRLLRADHSIIGGHFTEDRTGVFSHFHMLEILRFARPAAQSMLQIGLGTGSLGMALSPHGIVSDFVEIDPEVVRLARSHFGFSTTGTVYVEDARTFLNRNTRKYDLIVHDTFTGGATPSHLLSVEVLQQIKRSLRPGGILALNFVGLDTGPGAEAGHAVWRTLGEVFPTIRAFRDSPRGANAGLTNLIFFATDTSLALALPSDATFENGDCEHYLRSLSAWEVAGPPPPGRVITDARNPLSRLQMPVSELHFEAMGKLLPPEIWLP